MKNFFFPTARLLIALSFSLAACSNAVEVSRLQNLETTIRPRLDGMVDIEQAFRLHVDGITVKRGPVLRYMTVFASSGGLVLDTDMEIVEVTRDGKPEPFFISTKDGTSSLLLGSEEVLLEPGAYDYVIRFRRLGSWKKEDNQLVDSIDVTEAFRKFPIDHAVAKLELPDGAQFTRRSAAVYGTTADGPGFSQSLEDGTLIVETTAPLAANHSIFLNTSWTAEGFSGKNRWSQIVLQHPRIPMAAIGSVVLALALWVLVAGGLRRGRERKLAATPG